MTKPFALNLSSHPKDASTTECGEAKDDIMGVKNWSRPGHAQAVTTRLRGASLALAALLSALMIPSLAYAGQADEDEDDEDAAADTDVSDLQQRLKKVQDAIKKAQAEKAAKDARAAKEAKEAKEKAAKEAKEAKERAAREAKEAKEAKEKEAKEAKEAKEKASKDKSAKKEPSLEERAARGVVTIERGGQVVGMGMALANDGRILTALSPLGAGNDLDVRFADGTTVDVKLGHHDRMWDLALLVPQSGKWESGLTASPRDPVRQDAIIKSFTVNKTKTATAASLTLRGYRTLLGGDDKTLENAIELGSRVLPTDLGSPVVDEDGRVVAIVGRGCAPNENRPCTPVAFGIPINAIKSFLKTVPPTAVAPSPWLGIQGVDDASGVAKGVRITAVQPDSPAHEAQLKGGDRSTGDVILAVDGVPVTSPETLADTIRAHAVGEKVPLIIFSQGKYKQITVHLRASPGARGGSAKAPSHPAELPALPDAPVPRLPKPASR